MLTATIQCDQCGCDKLTVATPSAQHAAIRAAAREKGWQLETADLCPYCAGKAALQQEGAPLTAYYCIWWDCYQWHNVVIESYSREMAEAAIRHGDYLLEGHTPEQKSDRWGYGPHYDLRVCENTPEKKEGVHRSIWD